MLLQSVSSYRVSYDYFFGYSWVQRVKLDIRIFSVTDGCFSYAELTLWLNKYKIFLFNLFQVHKTLRSSGLGRTRCFSVEFTLKDTNTFTLDGNLTERIANLLYGLWSPMDGSLI